MKPVTQKQEEAAVRQAEHDALTPAQRVAKLDAKFGPGAGAKKERARLQKLIDPKTSAKIQEDGAKRVAVEAKAAKSKKVAA